MSILDKFKSWFVTDEELIEQKKQLSGNLQFKFVVPFVISTETVYQSLLAYGKENGFVNGKRNLSQSDVLLSSIKNQVIKMHEEILSYYKKHNQTPDEKLLNRLTLENMFYLSMGTAILAKVKKTNLIAAGFFSKLLKKSGPELFYREVAAMAGNKYGAENVEQLHLHIQRAVVTLLTSFNTKPDAREKTIECAKAIYMYGLAVTLKEKEENSN